MKKIAVLITGVPRGYERCLPTLQFLLSEYDVTYFAVMREEFADAQTIQGLKEAIPNIQFIVIPRTDSELAIEPFNGLAIAVTVVKMWHEVWYAYNAIPTKNFDLIFRTRFDIFFHEQYLPEIRDATNRDVYIPEQMRWSGSNDMLCLAAPAAFGKYAQTFKRLNNLYNEGVRTAEAYICRSMALADVLEQKLDVFFILYRDVLFSNFDNRQLCVVSLINPYLSTYKLGTVHDSAENRNNCIEQVDRLTKYESRFPLLVNNSDFNFFPPETDNRDGTTFRWLGMHGRLKRALQKTTYSLQFTVHYYIEGWKPEHLTILINGDLVKLHITGQDEFGRLKVSGLIDQNKTFRRPWSNIGFSCAYLVVPSKMNSDSKDHRALGVAISDITFISRPEQKKAIPKGIMAFIRSNQHDKA
jgi:hypothetical protein